MSELKVHARPCDIEPMVHIEEIRAGFVARLKQSLSAQGIDQWGAGARLAKIAEVTPKAASKWLNGETLPGAAKMRAIADALNVRIEWLQYGATDAPGIAIPSMKEGAEVIQLTSSADLVRNMLARHGKNLSDDARQKIADAVQDTVSELGAANVITGDFSRPGLVGDEVWIAHYDIRAAMGGGQIAHDFPEMLRDVRVSPQHLRELGVTFEDHNHLKMVTGWGQSMEPTIKHRDPLIVDVSIREFAGDGIYLFSWDDHIYIKRLQVEDSGRFEMISDNAKHKSRMIQRESTYILARVLLVWNAHLV